MLWIGLTGSIGCGKTTVAQSLQRRGLFVVNADALAKEAVALHSEGLKRIRQAFGPAVLNSAEELDRAKMAQLVFSSKQKLEQLEAIVHPLVRDLAQRERKKLEDQKCPMAFYDVPLLFEKGMEKMFDAIWVVTCSEEHQIQRLMARNHWTLEEIKKRIKSQMPVEYKCEKADMVITNDGTKEELETQISRALSQQRSHQA